MSQIDNIMRSLTTTLANTIVPIGNVYFDRAQQPAGLSGFPYMRVFIQEMPDEVISQTAPGTSLITYKLTIETWTVQQGGNDQVSDQCVYTRALDHALKYITPNTNWLFVTGFKHCLKNAAESDLRKDRELYQGNDVYKCTNVYSILCQE